jgi:hypothetical protein
VGTNGFDDDRKRLGLALAEHLPVLVGNAPTDDSKYADTSEAIPSSQKGTTPFDAAELKGGVTIIDSNAITRAPPEST